MSDIKQIEVSNVTYDVKDQTARDVASQKAPIASPTLTGIPTAPTAAKGTNTTQIATTAFVQTAMQDAGKVKSVNGQTGDVTINKSSVGLGNVENTKIAPVSKTTDMTQQVGIDSDGKLYTAPSGSSSAVTSVDGQTGAVTTYSVKYQGDQGLTNAQKRQARTNIGAGTSSFSGSYNDLTDQPSISTRVVVNVQASAYDEYDENAVFDKTYAQIKTAYDNGNIVIAYVTAGNYTGFAELAYIDGEFAKFSSVNVDQPDTYDYSNIIYASIGADGVKEAYFGSREFLPVVSDTDNGKTLVVKNGEWELGSISGGSYTLPVASATTLGGVKPVAKTNVMSQEVGVDANGGLYTEPADYVLTDADKTEIAEDVIAGGIEAQLGDEPLPAPASATVGQFIRAKTVVDGKITETEAADVSGGGGGETWELIKHIKVPDGAAETNALTINTDENGNAFSLKKAKIFGSFPKYTGASTIPTFSFFMLNGITTGDNCPYCYTSGWGVPVSSQPRRCRIEVDLTNQGLQIESTSRDYVTSGMSYFGPQRISAVTSIGGTNMLIYPGCEFWLYGVRA